MMSTVGDQTDEGFVTGVTISASTATDVVEEVGSMTVEVMTNGNGRRRRVIRAGGKTIERMGVIGLRQGYAKTMANEELNFKVGKGRRGRDVIPGKEQMS